MSIYTHTRPFKKNEKKINLCFLVGGVGGRSLWAAGLARDTWEHAAIITGAPFGAKA